MALSYIQNSSLNSQKKNDYEVNINKMEAEGCDQLLDLTIVLLRM